MIPDRGSRSGNTNRDAGGLKFECRGFFCVQISPGRDHTCRLVFTDEWGCISVCVCARARARAHLFELDLAEEPFELDLVAAI